MATWAFDESPVLSRFGTAKTAKFTVITNVETGKTPAEEQMKRAVGKDPPESKGGAPSSKRRDHMVQIEREVQEAWASVGTFQADADDERPKFFVTFPRGPVHLALYQDT